MKNQYWQPKTKRLQDETEQEEWRARVVQQPFWKTAVSTIFPPAAPFLQPWNPEIKKAGLWGLERALFPASATGMLQKELEDRPGAWLSGAVTEERPDIPLDPSMAIGSERYQRYMALPEWEKLKLEAPLWAATMLIPGATTLRAGLSPVAIKSGVRGAVAKTARTALAPIAAVEEAPAKVVGAIKRAIKPAPVLQNPLPYQMPAMTPYKVRKQIKIVADELATDLGKVPLERKPIVGATLKESLPQKLRGKGQGFITRTYRVEPLLDSMDKFVASGKYQLQGGKFTQAFWKPVNEASDAKIFGVTRGIQGLRDVAKPNNINLGEMLTRNATIDNITLTSSERIGIYLHSRNSDNLVHVIFGNNIPARTITKIANSLTPEERAIADYISAFMKEQTPLMQAAVKSATGKEMKAVESYFPIRIQRKALADLEMTQILIDERKLRFASRWASSKIKKGFTLPRTGKAMQPIEIDALPMFLEHLNSVEHYKAFMPVVRDLQGLLNNPTLKRTILERHNKATWEVLDQWLKDVASSNPLKVNNQFESMMRQLRVNSVTAVLGINTTTAMKQFPSFVSGAAEIGEMPALRGLITNLAHPKETSALIKKFSPQIYTRTIEREIAEAQLAGGAKRILTGKLTTKEVFMFLTTSMDKLAVKSLWRGAFDDALKRGLTQNAAAKYAERGIRRTQPFFSMKDIPEYWRSGEMAKALTIFTNQLSQYWNYYRFQIVGRRAAGEISNLEVVRRIFEAFIIPAYMIGTISRSRPARNAGEFVNDMASMGFATFPIVGSWVSSAVKGWYGNQGLITTELLQRTQDIAYNANKGQWDKVLQTIPELAGYAAGLPVAQPRRTIQAFMDLASGKSDDWLELIWGSYARRKAGGQSTPGGGRLSPSGGGGSGLR